ncbi:MAG: Two component response regulator receiver modulated diguanylate cyclase [Gemmatimonadetes bacterium]|nr:Two component response regulator receiver modulated diguanylate cyclase [Gemmatimonadota bacterium]
MTEDAMRGAMDAIWERSRGTIMARVATLESATLALRYASLPDDVRRDAERETHKLAGAAGTFGFWDASALAREAEEILRGAGPIAPADVARLRQIAIDLRGQLEAARPKAGAATQTLAPPSIEALRAAHARLLVVGDDAAFHERLASEARSLGINVLGASRAAEARELLAEHVDAVLLDLTLEGTGIPFLEEVYNAHPALPVIVVSDGEHFLDRVEAARLGGRGFLQKPVRPSQVIDLLRDSLFVVRSESSTIVAVDDDPALLAVIEGLLLPLRARVITVTDPLRVLSVLAESSPDLVILDVDMPSLNGIELCRVLRNDPRWAAVPVMFLSAQTERAEVTKMFEAGADDYVAKPVVGAEIVSRVRNRLERTRMLRLAADVDSLTGVGTRRRGIEVLERFIRLAQRQLLPISVAVIDLDHFKDVNDRFGHLTGDMVLRRVAAVLSNCFRGEDVVARWGGEEFLIGMYSMPGEAAARRLTLALEKLRAEKFDTVDSDLSVTFSAGVAEFPMDGTDWTSLYRVADEALGRAKAGGRNRVVGPAPHSAVRRD